MLISLEQLFREFQTLNKSYDNCINVTPEWDDEASSMWEHGWTIEFDIHLHMDNSDDYGVSHGAVLSLIEAGAECPIFCKWHFQICNVFNEKISI